MGSADTHSGWSSWSGEKVTGSQNNTGGIKIPDLPRFLIITNVGEVWDVTFIFLEL